MPLWKKVNSHPGGLFATIADHLIIGNFFSTRVVNYNYMWSYLNKIINWLGNVWELWHAYRGFTLQVWSLDKHAVACRRFQISLLFSLGFLGYLSHAVCTKMSSRYCHCRFMTLKYRNQKVCEGASIWSHFEELNDPSQVAKRLKLQYRIKIGFISMKFPP